MKRIMITALLLAVFSSGCTTPSNKIADEAFKRGSATESSIIVDLTTLAMQAVVDKQALAARTAAAVGNADAAAKAVTDMATAADKIFWLAYKQHARAKEMQRIAQRYIWEQRGWWSVLSEDFTNAKKQVDERRAGSGE